MSLFFKYLLRTSVISLVSFTLCTAIIQSVTTKFTEKKSVATSHTTLQKISKIKSVWKNVTKKDKMEGALWQVITKLLKRVI